MGETSGTRKRTNQIILDMCEQILRYKDMFNWWLVMPCFVDKGCTPLPTLSCYAKWTERDIIEKEWNARPQADISEWQAGNSRLIDHYISQSLLQCSQFPIVHSQSHDAKTGQRGLRECISHGVEPLRTLQLVTGNATVMETKGHRSCEENAQEASKISKKCSLSSLSGQLECHTARQAANNSRLNTLYPFSSAARPLLVKARGDQLTSIFFIKKHSNPLIRCIILKCHWGSSLRVGKSTCWW